MTRATRDSSGTETRLTFAAGGWVILLASIIVVAIVIFAFLGPMSGVKPIGDGRDPATYGFDLSNLSVARESLAGSGNPRDFLRSLDNPATITGAEIAPRNEAERIKYAVSADRVIGITINGESRAYPLQLMNVHEICNDVLGGVHIAVTYSPLCDSAVIFDRTVDGRVVRFGVSGLLLNSNLVMYDHAEFAADDSAVAPIPIPAHTPSLWSQLAFRAIAGPAATTNTSLTLRPGTQICTWAAWFLLHPETTIAMPADNDKRRMKAMDYERYWREEKVTFPVCAIAPRDASHRTIPFSEIAPAVAPLLDGGLSTMTPILAVQYQHGWKVIPLVTLIKFVDTTTFTADSSMLGVQIQWRIVPGRGALVQESEAMTNPMPVMVPCRWFAWQAFHPQQPAVP
ncbi:MAG: DUF3179 domain-containing protein [Phycisphaerales bacterium]|nr:DUF3179 domain-containing protein [Phycisphaerales bacterium]